MVVWWASRLFQSDPGAYPDVDKNPVIRNCRIGVWEGISTPLFFSLATSLIPISLLRRGAHLSKSSPLETVGALGVGAVAAGIADDEDASALAAARLAGRHVERCECKMVGGNEWSRQTRKKCQGRCQGSCVVKK